MRIVMNNVFSEPEKMGTDPSCRFREIRKNRLAPTHFTSEKWRHRVEGWKLFSTQTTASDF